MGFWIRYGILWWKHQVAITREPKRSKRFPAWWILEETCQEKLFRWNIGSSLRLQWPCTVDYIPSSVSCTGSFTVKGITSSLTRNAVQRGRFLAACGTNFAPKWGLRQMSMNERLVWIIISSGAVRKNAAWVTVAGTLDFLEYQAHTRTAPNWILVIGRLRRSPIGSCRTSTASRHSGWARKWCFTKSEILEPLFRLVNQREPDCAKEAAE